MTTEDLAREIYTLLVLKKQHPNGGYTLKTLEQKFNVLERTLRDAISTCSKRAAVNAHKTLGLRILGYDPETQLMVDADTPEVSERVIRHLYSRYSDMHQRVLAMNAAHASRFGKEIRLETDEQQALFGEAA